MYIIAKDGSGDFTSLQAAIDAVPMSSRMPTILLLRMDEYHEKVIVNKDNIRIIGEARDRTVITNSGCAKDLDADGKEKGTFLSYTFLVTGNNVEVENLTIRNDAGDGSLVGQAVAVYAAGDRGVWRNVRMIAHQDTLFCGPTMPKVARDALPRLIPEGVTSVGDCPLTLNRQYFEDCYIQGDVDFIFGPYRCWFERCTLFMNKRGGLYTAANTPEQSPYGLVFHNCKLTGECAPGQAYLGRPWRAFARTVFLHCEMDEHVSPQGFQDWQGGAPVTERYAEYSTTGARADQSTRHPKQKRMTEADAAAYTIREVIGGYDNWHPQHRTPTWFLCGDSTMADYPANAAPMTGWGQALKRLVPENVFVENCAVCGRSSKSFVAEKRLNFVELCLRKGDKLFIQFGHNDEKPDVDRATDAHVTYPEYLGMYIDAARRQGAEPILLTPIARRRFDENGKLQHTHGEYPAVMRDLADYRGVRLLDIYRNARARVLICAVSRKGQTTIPSGDFELKTGDKIYVTAAPEHLSAFFQYLGVFRKKASTVMIVGASKMCYYLADELLHMGMSVKIVDQNEARCAQMSEQLPRALVIMGDGTDSELLAEEGIDHTDAFVALTGLDEANILMAMCASRQTEQCKVVAKINRRSLMDLVSSEGIIDSVVSARDVTTELIVQYVRAMEGAAGSQIKTLHRLVEGAVEALEFHVDRDPDLVNVPLRELKLRSGVLIAGIVRRDGEIVIPGGNDTIRAGDDVIVVTQDTALQELRDILRQG